MKASRRLPQSALLSTTSASYGRLATASMATPTYETLTSYFCECLSGPLADMTFTTQPRVNDSRSKLVAIAMSTLDKIEQGSYDFEGRTFDLTKGIQEMKKGTTFFPEDSDLSRWRTRPSMDGPDRTAVSITITERSTLSGARALSLERNLHYGDTCSRKRIGVLSFASATSPGGGFLKGAQAQEESIARSSTLYPSLMTETAQAFYQSHRKDPHGGYYTHAMIYSPRVSIIRSDDGTWHEPIEVEIVTSCAVNAGVVRQHPSDEDDIDHTMQERMGRVLYLFEKQGVRNLVLGSFGTGAFRNRVDLVAGVWKELLVGENARFRFSFDRVEFSILGTSTYMTFKQIFSDNPIAGVPLLNSSNYM